MVFLATPPTHNWYIYIVKITGFNCYRDSIWITAIIAIILSELMQWKNFSHNKAKNLHFLTKDRFLNAPPLSFDCMYLQCTQLGFTQVTPVWGEIGWIHLGHFLTLSNISRKIQVFIFLIIHLNKKKSFYSFIGSCNNFSCYISQNHF